MISEKVLNLESNKIINSNIGLIETIARSEFNRISSHLVEYYDLINIGAMTIHTLISENPEKEYSNAYLATAIKWAIRNELRRRYKWYSLKPINKEELNAQDKYELREAVYQTILSIDDDMSNDNPIQIRDNSHTPEQCIEFNQLCTAIKESMKILPPREYQLIENRFFKNKKLRDLSEEYNISPSRISRIIQSGLNKIKKELILRDVI